MDTPDTPANAAPQPGPGPSEGGAAPAIPNGPVAAAMLATGIGEASEGVHDFLEWSERVGPLSGVTSLAVIAFVLAWGGLYAGLRDRDLPWRPLIVATVVLLAIALVFTYPPFFQLFKSD
jgi:hypothetical protein